MGAVNWSYSKLMSRRSFRNTRSTLVLGNVVVGGKRTSMRLEKAMWDALGEIAVEGRTNINELVTRISRARGLSTRTSAVRVFIMNFYRDRLRAAEPRRFRPTLVHSRNERGSLPLN